MFAYFIPFFLTTNLSVSNENDWKLGPEFTFLVHFNLTINNNTDMYHLNAASFSTCRPKDMNTLSCYLDPLKGDASEHNLITKRFQRQDQQSVFGNIPFEIMYSAKGVENYTFPKNVSENAQFQMAIKAIVNLMNIRSDVMNKTEESFVETDTFLLGECHTKYHIKQLSEVEKKENKEDFGLQFPSSFQKTTDKPLEIKKDRDLKNCKSFTNVLLSAFDVHGVENPKVTTSYNKVIVSSEEFMSQSIITASGTDKKLSIKEDWSLKLRKIEPAKTELSGISDSVTSLVYERPKVI